MNSVNSPSNLMTAVEAQQLVCASLRNAHTSARNVLAVYKKMERARSKLLRYAQVKNVREGNRLEPTKELRAAAMTDVKARRQTKKAKAAAVETKICNQQPPRKKWKTWNEEAAKWAEDNAAKEE